MSQKPWATSESLRQCFRDPEKKLQTLREYPELGQFVRLYHVFDKFVLGPFGAKMPRAACIADPSYDCDVIKSEPVLINNYFKASTATCDIWTDYELNQRILCVRMCSDGFLFPPVKNQRVDGVQAIKHVGEHHRCEGCHELVDIQNENLVRMIRFGRTWLSEHFGEQVETDTTILYNMPYTRLDMIVRAADHRVGIGFYFEFGKEIVSY